MSNTLAFKCYLKSSDGRDNEIRRFTVESDVVGNFTYLKEKVRATFPQLLRENFNLMYMDEENDKITLSSDDELVAALMYAKRKEDEPFRLYIQIVGGQKPTPAATESIGNCQGEIHFGVTCDGCQGGVRGFRYKCMQCPDFDLCGKCETAGQHPGHTIIRVSGPMPASFPAMKNLLVGGPEVPHWRRKHHGRMGHCNPHHGKWNAWCPSGINVEIDPPTCEAESKPKAAGTSCPFKANMEQAKEQAKQAARAVQENGPEFLQGLGTTIATILEQFGIDTLVDVHGPGANGTCPRETAAKKQAEKPANEKGEEKPEEKASKQEEKAKKEVIVPITIEKEQVEPEKKTQNKTEIVIPIEIVKSATTSEGEPTKPTADAHPYAEVAGAVAAVKAAEAAASKPNESSGDKSPSRESDDWTLVGEVVKQAAAALVQGAELGARPKTPPKPEEISLHSDPLVAAALEKMLAMGFTNEGGWLAQLLEAKGGDIGKALDVLHAPRARQQQ